MRKSLLLAAAALAAAAPLAAQAQFAKPEDAIKYRQAAYTVLGAHFGRIGAMVNNRVPFNAQEVQTNAAIVEAMAKLPFTAFGQGTETGGNTRAKSEIWKETDKFHAGAKDMQERITALYKVSQTGDQAQIRTAFGAAANTCKSCHDAYRRE